MTSRRSPPRRSSGSRARRGAAAVVLASLALLAVPATSASRAAAAGRGDEAASPAALVEHRDGVEIDWAAGTLTARGGAAADLHMPSAEIARAGSVRRAEVAARARLGRALAELPLGGDRKLPAAAAERALAHARTTATDYQSNGGALVRVTVRFEDWLEPAPAGVAPVAITLAVPAMRLAASPLAKVGDAERPLGAAVYRLGAPPEGAKAVPAKLDRAGRLVIEARHAPSAEKLAASAALIYVGKVLK
jgi:hypothetical protein